MKHMVAVVLLSRDMGVLSGRPADLSPMRVLIWLCALCTVSMG